MMRSFNNLLPFEHRRTALLRSRFLQWCLVWIACVLIAAGLWWLKESGYRRSLDTMETAQRSYLPLKKLMRQREATRSELDRLHAKGTLLGQLREQRPILTLLGAVSESARKCGGRLVVRNLSFERHETPAETDAPARKTSKKKRQPPPEEKALPWATVTFQGDALDNLAIATFAAGLRDAGLFRRVELKSSVGKQSADTAVHSFVVECDI